MDARPVKQKRALPAAYWLVVITVTLCLVLLDSNHCSLAFRCGLLPRNDSYLDGTGRVFQKCTWHLGNATRTWGETYGIKVFRLYFSLGVKHTNPQVTLKDAHEDD